MDIVPFKPSHLRAINPQDEQEGASILMDAEQMQMVVNGWAASLVDGRDVLACAGIAESNERLWAWAVLSGDCRRGMVRMIRAMGRGLWGVPSERPIHAMARVGFDAGARMLSIFGFQMTDEEHTGPDGRLYRVWVL